MIFGCGYHAFGFVEDQSHSLTAIHASFDQSLTASCTQNQMIPRQKIYCQHLSKSCQYRRTDKQEVPGETEEVRNLWEMALLLRGRDKGRVQPHQSIRFFLLYR